MIRSCALAALMLLLAAPLPGIAQDDGACTGACADMLEQYRLEAEKWRLMYDTLKLEHELLQLDLEKCRQGVEDTEIAPESVPEAEADPGLPYIGAAMAACDLAWADAVIAETEFSCARISLEDRLDDQDQVTLTIESAGEVDSRDGCLITAESPEWNATSEAKWTP